MRAVNWPDDLESPNDAFFKHATVQHLIQNAENESEFDFNKILAGTPSDLNYAFKENLVKCISQITKRGGKGFFWAVGSTNNIEKLESTPNFARAHIEQMPLGYDCVLFMGILDKKMRIYADPLLSDEEMLVGVGFSNKPKSHYLRLKIKQWESGNSHCKKYKKSSVAT